VPGKRSRVGKLQSKHYNDWIAFGFEDVVFEACRDANALRAAGLIRHDATTCRLPQRYAVEDLTASGVECQKIAVESCSEDQSGSRDRDPCDYRLGRFTAPADNAVVRIDGGDPAFLTLVFLAESICRTEKRLAGFEDRSLRVELYGAAKSRLYVACRKNLALESASLKDDSTVLRSSGVIAG